MSNGGSTFFGPGPNLDKCVHPSQKALPLIYNSFYFQVLAHLFIFIFDPSRQGFPNERLLQSDLHSLFANHFKDSFLLISAPNNHSEHSTRSIIQPTSIWLITLKITSKSFCPNHKKMTSWRLRLGLDSSNPGSEFRDYNFRFSSTVFLWRWNFKASLSFHTHLTWIWLLVMKRSDPIEPLSLRSMCRRVQRVSNMHVFILLRSILKVLFSLLFLDLPHYFPPLLWQQSSNNTVCLLLPIKLD